MDSHMDDTYHFMDVPIDDYTVTGYIEVGLTSGPEPVIVFEEILHEDLLIEDENRLEEIETILRADKGLFDTLFQTIS
ncbi:MAG: hypothetical protein OEY01_03460 [Desulfobulbaceae bacterium]|nr:hypothetical protein [Desulfobulbaceae bacterium]